MGDVAISNEELRGIIADRKKQCKRETLDKLKENARFIRGLNNKSMDGLHPLELLPKEVWLMVFDKLNPENKQNVMKVHEVFDNLLANILIGDILFPQVLPFKVEPFWIKKRPSPETIEKKSLLPLASFIELRKVSKSLRNEIDRWFEDNLLDNLQNEMRNRSETFQTSRLHLLLHSHHEKLKQMHADFCSRNPKRFFIRSLSLILQSYEDQITLTEDERENFLRYFDESKTILNDILDHIGGQIWHFSFDLSDLEILTQNGISFVNCYNVLVECLSRMPNLKWLRMGIHTQRRSESYRIPAEQEKIPKLADLQRIDFVTGSIVNEADTFQVFDAVLSENPNVKILNMYGQSETFKRLLSNGRIQSLRLEKLGVIGYSAEDIGLFQSVSSNNCSSWQLRKIRLDLNRMDESLFMLFKYLEKFPTLEDVFLSIGNVTIGNDVTSLSLQLPNLTRFDLKMKPKLQDWSDGMHLLFSLRFLLFAKKLKSLKWDCKMTESDHQKLRKNMENQEAHGQGGLIHFEGGWGDMRHSNIWDVFPWLEVIDIKLVEKLTEGGERTRSKSYHRRKLLSSKVSQVNPEVRPTPQCFYDWVNGDDV